jgi:hypothetical protein
LGINGFDLGHAEDFYPQLYELRFENSDCGYAFLEKEMQRREPSYGYSVLAWILASTPHKVVITTNFDNLVADALLLHSDTFPRVVGHDALASFVQAALRRPLIAKVHGDLGFKPCNTLGEIGQLSNDWRDAITRVLERFTPIVIGYGGNDGSLMATLEDHPAGVPDTIYWCQRKGDAPSQRVLNLLNKVRGYLVTVESFDTLMLLLEGRIRVIRGMPDLFEAMRTRTTERERAYAKTAGRTWNKSSR